jgi:hypothetical protein
MAALFSYRETLQAIPGKGKNFSERICFLLDNHNI